MNVRIRVWMGVIAIILLFTVVIVPTSDGKADPCNACGATCMMEYKTGASDCTGSGGCTRITVCP
jgi:hypothetical protein